MGVSIRYCIRFFLDLASSLYAHEKSFFEKNFYVQEINEEKMQKLSAIVTTISDKQYQND